MNDINMKLVKVKGKTRQDLLDALLSLSEMDADFSGDNGIEYLWDGVDATKYNSNAEYLLDLFKKEKSDKKLIEKFVARWVESDNYYVEHILDVVYDTDGKAESIALATMS